MSTAYVGRAMPTNRPPSIQSKLSELQFHTLLIKQPTNTHTHTHTHAHRHTHTRSEEISLCTTPQQAASAAALTSEWRLRVPHAATRVLPYPQPTAVRHNHAPRPQRHSGRAPANSARAVRLSLPSLRPPRCTSGAHAPRTHAHAHTRRPRSDAHAAAAPLAAAANTCSRHPSPCLAS